MSEESVQASAQEAQPLKSEGLEEAVGEVVAKQNAEEYEPEAQEEVVQNLIKKFKLKVDGKEIEEEIDLSDEDLLRNKLQLAAAARKRMQEAADKEKEIQAAYQRFLEDPFSVMEENGMNPDELAEARIRQRIEEMKKSPEQLEHERIQRELQQARQEAQKLKAEKEEAEMARLRQEAHQNLENEMISALEAHKTLPNSPYVVKRISDVMMWAMDNGRPDVTVDEVLPIVEQEIRGELNNFYDNLPDDMLEKFISNKITERMRKKRLSSAKLKNLSQVKPTGTSVKRAEKKSVEPISVKDFFKKL